MNKWEQCPRCLSKIELSKSFPWFCVNCRLGYDEENDQYYFRIFTDGKCSMVISFSNNQTRIEDDDWDPNVILTLNGYIWDITLERIQKLLLLK